jgi:hypothetical protein
MDDINKNRLKKIYLVLFLDVFDTNRPDLRINRASVRSLETTTIAAIEVSKNYTTAQWCVLCTTNLFNRSS